MQTSWNFMTLKYSDMWLYMKQIWNISDFFCVCKPKACSNPWNCISEMLSNIQTLRKQPIKLLTSNWPRMLKSKVLTSQFSHCVGTPESRKPKQTFLFQWKFSLLLLSNSRLWSEEVFAAFSPDTWGRTLIDPRPQHIKKNVKVDLLLQQNSIKKNKF